MMNAAPGNTIQNRMVLAIAGSDPGGGAGIQADLKTFAAIGVYGGAAVTCITVQNTRTVKFVHPLPAELVADQITTVLDDMPVTHVKTGMLGNGAIAAAVTDALASFTGEIVCDPVLLSSSGTPLLNPDDLDLFTETLAAKATMLTPNLPELEVLSGCSCRSEEEIAAAAGHLFSSLQKLRVIVVKGGHFQEKVEAVTDFLFLRPAGSNQPPLMEAVRHPRLKTRNTHGTGCTFASALAAFHLICGDDRRSFRQASTFLFQLLQKSSPAKFGADRGPLLHHLCRSDEEYLGSYPSSPDYPPTAD